MELLKTILIYIMCLFVYIILGITFLKWYRAHYLQDITAIVAIASGMLTAISGWLINSKIS